MTTEMTMPKLSDTMEEGTILKWRIKVGDRVTRGEVIAEVETDKAAMEMEAFEDGTVTDLKAKEGDTVPVGTVIAVLSPPGEASGEVPLEETVEEETVEEETVEEETVEEETVEEETVEEETAVKGPSEDVLSSLRPAASPAARRLALEREVDLARLRGSGPGGRIIMADVERAAVTGGPSLAGGSEGEREAQGQPPVKKSVKVRRIVERKMVESWQNIPHFYVTVAVDMTDVIRFRKDLRVSINDFILAAATHSLQEHPWVNSHWVEGESVAQKEIEIAMAVATDRGLYNPVLRDCGSLSLRQISARAKDLADRAHRGKLRPGDLEGGTFTITNMGMLGVESFSAIITPPQAAVLAVGTVKGEVVVDEKGEPGIAPLLRLTLSADHRVLDGADAADFLATLKSYLEAPVTLVTCEDETGRS
ncbi:MAG: hypothetical protein C0617_10860 [Desulfuromonas sp.]|uniref:dihydrolipoamide acetyltransferase family protein n=2 Tax=Desulfuromonas TaxID=890 RepID=UPI000CB98CA0|nr:dihydrolipoamide acetyltransferase family protein [Desulfuromonas sp.]PLX83629.1 MAG: hypothetical protein C0617_10860 [Desulfuromonas sp.]